MRYLIRTGVAAGVAAFALAFAGGALAALDPKLIVVSPPATGAGTTSITASVEPTDDPVAKVTMYAPLGYQLNSPDAGQKIGDVEATALAADLGGAVLPLKGQIMATSPTDPAVSQASASCDNVGHSAVWLMQLAAAGQQLNIPMFIDRTAAEEAKRAAYKIVICLPPPDVPAGTPGRAQFGAKLLSASFDVNAFANPFASGEYRWRSVWTPYTPKTGQVNAAGTVESQAVVRLPTSVTPTVKKQHVIFRHERQTLLTITGKLGEAGQSIPAQLVGIQAGKSKTRLYPLKAVMTKADGTYVEKLYISSPQWFMTEVTLPIRVTGTAKSSLRLYSREVIRIGTCSWADEGLLSTWYPPSVRTAAERLAHYAARFDVVEADSPFYRLPTPETTARWAERTPPGFTFFVKASGEMTGHRTADRDGSFRAFREAVAPLEAAGKLRGVLLQYPPWVSKSREAAREILRARDLLDPLTPLVEFRHASWLVEGELATTLELCERNGLAFVSLDAPPNALPRVAAATGPLAYVRFHGRNRDTWFRKTKTSAERFDWLYGRDELTEWVDPLRRLASQAEEVYALFNNNRDDFAPRSAQLLRGLLDEAGIDATGGAEPERAEPTLF